MVQRTVQFGERLELDEEDAGLSWEADAVHEEEQLEVADR